jgi:hypothetical protein
VTQNRAAVMLAEAQIPAAIAVAIRAGYAFLQRTPQVRSARYRDPQLVGLSLEQSVDPRAKGIAQSDAITPRTNPNR